MSTITIEMLKPRHARVLNRLTREALQTDPAAFTTDFSQIRHRPLSAVASHLAELQDSRGFRLGAFDRHGDLLGTIQLNPRAGKKIDHGADLLFFFVHPDYRSRGIGSLLLQRAIDEARGIKGLMQLELLVSHDASAAMRVYEKFGFEATGVLRRQIRHAGRYFDLEVMWLSL